MGIKVEYGEELEEPQDKGTFTTVGNVEHSEMMLLYADGLSMDKVSKKMKRSPRTVSQHLHKHDRAVEGKGYCPRCQRASGEYATITVTRKDLRKN